MVRASCFALFALVVGVTPCFAEGEEPAESVSPATSPGTGESGLSGMQDMVEGRIAKQGQLGTVFSVDYVQQDVYGGLFGDRFDQDIDVTQYSMTVGVGLFDVIELAIKLPWVTQQVNTDFGGVGRFDADERGWGDVVFSVKGGLTIDMLSIAAYTRLEAPTGDDDVFGGDTASGELGAAITLSIADGLLGVHGNLAFVDIEGGTQIMKYALGLSSVIGADAFVVKPYLNLLGFEFEGPTGSNFFVDYGVQAFIAEIVFVELAGSNLLLDDGVEDANAKSFALRFAVGLTLKF